MPHTSTTTVDSSISTITLPNKPDHPLVAQARASANSIFRSHVQIVLQHSSSEGLRRLIKSRIRTHFLHNEINVINGAYAKNNTEWPLVSTTSADDGTSNLLIDNPNLLQVTGDDVDNCYAFAKRIGMKWADELKRQGCLEFSDIVMQVVNNGYYLEPQRQQQHDKHTEAGDGRITTPNADNNKFATPYTALHSLKRSYKPDCDESGKPLKHLRVAQVQQNENESSARKIIDQIDDMARNCQTYWHHGWDAIEEAVKRNKERIDYSRANQDDEMKERKGKNKRVHFEGETEEQMDDVSEVSKKSRNDTSRPTCELPQINTVSKTDERIGDRGRPASAIGDTMYSWNAILHSMTSQERRDLIMNSFHPPYPFESGIANESDYIHPTATLGEDCSVNVVGALKQVGETHLFEQTRHLSKEQHADYFDVTSENHSKEFETFLGAYKSRSSFKSHQLNRVKKKALRRAEKERLGRRVHVAGEKNADYNGLGTAIGKVKLTEKVQSPSTNVKRKTSAGNELSLQIYDEPERQKWLEIDVGECFLEEVEGDYTAQVKKKRILAFRSLEMAIMD